MYCYNYGARVIVPPLYLQNHPHLITIQHNLLLKPLLLLLPNLDRLYPIVGIAVMIPTPLTRPSRNNILIPGLEGARFTGYEDKREMVQTSVSTCGLQRQSNKGKLRSKKEVSY